MRERGGAREQVHALFWRSRGTEKATKKDRKPRLAGTCIHREVGLVGGPCRSHRPRVVDGQVHDVVPDLKGTRCPVVIVVITRAAASEKRQREVAGKGRLEAVAKSVRRGDCVSH